MVLMSIGWCLDHNHKENIKSFGGIPCDTLCMDSAKGVQTVFYFNLAMQMQMLKKMSWSINKTANSKYIIYFYLCDQKNYRQNMSKTITVTPKSEMRINHQEKDPKIKALEDQFIKSYNKDWSKVLNLHSTS